MQCIILQRKISLSQALDPECCSCHWYSHCSEVPQGEVYQGRTVYCWSCSGPAVICANGDRWPRGHQACWGKSALNILSICIDVRTRTHNQFFLFTSFRASSWTTRSGKTQFCVRLSCWATAPWLLNTVQSTQVVQLSLWGYVSLIHVFCMIISQLQHQWQQYLSVFPAAYPRTCCPGCCQKGLWGADCRPQSSG